MVLLSPPKLLMILVIALIVLGPDKLPSVARRIGATWSDFTRWRTQLESEVRATFPEIPSTTEIARAVRSPVSLLDRLAEEHRLAEDDPSAADRAPSAEDHARLPSSQPPTGRPAAVTPPPSPPTRADVGVSADPSTRPDVSSMN
jgi:TatA/E family protein of Tat protein translocase